MKPKEAHEALLKSGKIGMDDQDSSWYPVRWYFNENGILCRCEWRGIPQEFPEFKRETCPVCKGDKTVYSQELGVIA